ncbi:hypothetical protein J6590_031849 [Homalodisca vitripennis]|nr:hypothetical protein J6590_031849 [Homalodisca vitripennis]
MVQGDRGVKGVVESKYQTLSSLAAWQKPVAEDKYKSKTGEKNSSKQDNKYGSWGPLFKNKQNFVNMHCC